MQESLQGISEIRLIRLHQKVQRQADRAFVTGRQMDINPLGSKTAPKVLTIIYYAELGKPYVLLALQGINSARGRNGTEGKGTGEKANGSAVMAAHRGSKFAPTRKGADFSYGIS